MGGFTLHAAIALSVANKAKTRDMDGILLIVEAHWGQYGYHWTLHRITGNDWSGLSYGPHYESLSLALAKHKVSPDDKVWVPLEDTEERKEQES